MHELPTISPVTDQVRDEARKHIRDHALGEAARIEPLPRVREVVLGVQDGLLVPLGVVTGMAAAIPGRSAILVAGIAEAVAGCIAMRRVGSCARRGSVPALRSC